MRPDFLPPDVARRHDFVEACGKRDLGAIFAIAMKYGGPGFTASHVARRCEMTVSQVGDYVRHGRQAREIQIFERVSDGLHIPGAMLGVGQRSWEPSAIEEAGMNDADESSLPVCEHIPADDSRYEHQKRDGLTARRKAVGYSQEQLAETLRVDRSTIGRWESNETAPQPWVRPKLAKALQISLDQLNSLLDETDPAPTAIVTHGSNDLLRRALAACGCSNSRLARSVVELAEREYGLSFKYDHTSVIRWLNGQRPRDPVPEIVALVMSERLQRIVTPADIGMPDPASPEENKPDYSLAYVLTKVTADDFTDSAIPWEPDMASRTAESTLDGWDKPEIDKDPLVRVLTLEQVGVEEINQLEATVHAFRTWDHQFGGGMRRKAVVGQLNELTELLRHPHPRALHRRLFSVAAQLAVIIGHMSGDSHRDGLAYRYLALALSAARESGDANLGARVANATARQLLNDGQTTDALSMLDRAQKTLVGLSGDKAALLLTSKAWAHAHLGAYDPMARSLDEASELLARYPAQGIFGPAEMAGVSGACFEVLAHRSGNRRVAYAQQAESRILAALEMREPYYVRSRTLDLVGLANVRLSQGEPGMAMETGELALNGAAKLRSERANQRIHGLAVRALEEFADLAQVSEFADKVRTRLRVT